LLLQRIELPSLACKSQQTIKISCPFWHIATAKNLIS